MPHLTCNTSQLGHIQNVSSVGCVWPHGEGKWCILLCLCVLSAVSRAPVSVSSEKETSSISLSK